MGQRGNTNAPRLAIGAAAAGAASSPRSSSRAPRGPIQDDSTKWRAETPEGDALLSLSSTERREATGPPLPASRGRRAVAGVRPTPRSAAVALALAMVGAIGVRALCLGTAPDERLLGLVPDDAFYYFGIARGFADRGLWSFDGGLSPASGFHLLHAYFNAMLASWYTPDQWRSILGTNLACAWVATSLALGLTAAALYRRFGLWGVVGCVPVALSRNFLLNSTNALEWSWVVLASAAFVSATEHPAPRRWRGPAAFGAGALGSLARFDFGAVPAIWTASALASRFLGRNGASSRQVAVSAAGLAGSAAATLAALAHHWLLFGDPIPSSARVKGLWAETLGSSFKPALLLDLVGVSALPHSRLIAFAIAACVGSWIYRARGRPRACLGENGWPVTAAALTVACYLALYASSAGVQLWYSQNFVIAALWLVGSGVAYGARDRRRPWVAIPLAAGIACVAVSNVRASLEPEWPWQISFEKAGRALAERPELGRVGSWNAGIMGYFEGGGVVNLDGLVNADVLPYLVQGKLACYLQQHDIRHLADFDRMLSEGLYPLQGGYADGLLRAAAVPVEELAAPIDPSTGGWRAASLELYRLDWTRVPALDCPRVLPRRDGSSPERRFGSAAAAPRDAS